MKRKWNSYSSMYFWSYDSLGKREYRVSLSLPFSSHSRINVKEIIDPLIWSQISDWKILSFARSVFFMLCCDYFATNVIQLDRIFLTTQAACRQFCGQTNWVDSTELTLLARLWCYSREKVFKIHLCKQSWTRGTIKLVVH